MPTKGIDINEDNILEWLCSVGYLLPSNEKELTRFECLHPPGSLSINSSAIDPFAILDGSWERKPLSISTVFTVSLNQDELRMAARKSEGLPGEIMEQIRRNQLKKDNQDD